MCHRQSLLALVVTATWVLNTANAQIYRWDNGRLIPGTEGITPKPLVDLGGWNTDLKNLRFGEFTGNLTNANFAGNWLNDARFAGANLTGA